LRRRHTGPSYHIIDNIPERWYKRAMPPIVTPTTAVMSPRVCALILTSPHLRRRLLPEGLGDPYEVLDYQAMLVIHDAEGNRATFWRTQDIRFLQDGVSGILDHAWGGGVLLSQYSNSAGALEGSFKDEGRRHLLIGLKRAMSRGETLGFEVYREARVGFTRSEE